MSLVMKYHATHNNAGHIPGSASILLELKEDERVHRLWFSDDLGLSVGGGPCKFPANPVLF